MHLLEPNIIESFSFILIFKCQYKLFIIQRQYPYSLLTTDSFNIRKHTICKRLLQNLRHDDDQCTYSLTTCIYKLIYACMPNIHIHTYEYTFVNITKYIYKEIYFSLFSIKVWHLFRYIFIRNKYNFHIL